MVCTVLIASVVITGFPAVFADSGYGGGYGYGSGYGSAPCGYSTRYYAYYYPMLFKKMNKTFYGFSYYVYPMYYPNPTYQVSVTSNPTGLPVSGSGQFCMNQKTQVSVTPMISGNTGMRYVFTGWSGDYTGTSPTGDLTVTGSMNIVANFKTQYMLTVSSQYATATGTGWYDAGSTATVSLNTNIVDLATGVRARFNGWSGDASGQSIPVTVDMSAPKTVAATWKNQYYVTASSTLGNVDGSGWYDEGAPATLAVNSPVPAGYGSQYVFDRWVGTTEISSNPAQITVNGPMSMSAQWRLDQTILFETIGVLAAIVIVSVGASLLFVRKKRAASK